CGFADAFGILTLRHLVSGPGGSLSMCFRKSAKVQICWSESSSFHAGIPVQRMPCFIFRIVAVTVSADQVKHGNAAVVGDDGFPIEQERGLGQRWDRRDDEGKAGREIVALAGDQPNTDTIAPGHDPHSVVLYFMEPTRTGRWGLGG